MLLLIRERHSRHRDPFFVSLSTNFAVYTATKFDAGDAWFLFDVDPAAAGGKNISSSDYIFQLGDAVMLNVHRTSKNNVELTGLDVRKWFMFMRCNLRPPHEVTVKSD